MDDRAETYRQAAADCLELAKTTTDEKARATLLAMAQKWLELANGTSLRGLNSALSIFNDDQLRLCDSRAAGLAAVNLNLF